MTNNNNSGNDDNDEHSVPPSKLRVAVNGILGKLILAPLVLLAVGANTLIGKGKPDWVKAFDHYAEDIQGGFVTVCCMILFIMGLTTAFVVLVLGPLVGTGTAAVIGWFTFPVGSTAWDLATLEDEQ